MRNHHLSGAVGRISTGRLTCLLAAGLLLCTSPSVAVDELPDSGEEVLDSGDLPLPDNVRAGALAQRAVLRAFCTNNPTTSSSPLSWLELQGQAMDTTPLMGISAGNPPHAIYVNFRQSSTYIGHGFLEPLEILLSRILSDNERGSRWTKDDEWIADPTAAEVDGTPGDPRSRT